MDTTPSAPRPPGYVSGVIIPPRIAYVLETRASLSTLRTSTRGDDSELDSVLNAIRWLAMEWSVRANGSAPRKPTEGAVNWYSPAQVATRTGLTEHAVRLAIREGRIPATKHDGRWHISPADYLNCRARAR